MNYAIEVLEKEVSILKKCLNDWMPEKYPEAKKQRDNMLKDLLDAIEKLKK